MVKLGMQYKPKKPAEETILYEKVEPHIARVTLNRPEKCNALLAPEDFLELGRKVQMGVDDDEIKVIILRGKGRSFCTGDDLNRVPLEALGGKPGYKPPQSHRLLGYRRLLETSFRDVLFCPKTIICQAHGPIMGYGTCLVEISDLVIAGESATFSHVEARIGFSGLSMTMFTLLLTIGPKRTREWLLTGRTLTAHEAKEWGLVNAVVPDDKLDEETLRWARGLALHSTDGLAIGKFYLWLIYEMMGGSAAHTAYYAFHSLFTNLRWREDELNFLKMRVNEGATKKAFAARDAAWAKYGF